jgi:hypothetical protein
LGLIVSKEEEEEEITIFTSNILYLHYFSSLTFYPHKYSAVDKSESND